MRRCCYIPDQSKPDEWCPNPAVYEIQFGYCPTPDDTTDACAEHVGVMLDNSDRFEILRIEETNG